MIGTARFVEGVRSYEGQRREVLPINSTVDYIRAHFNKRLTVEDLSDHAGLSARQLRRTFREIFGLSVQDFLIQT